MNILTTFNFNLLSPSQVYFGYDMEDAYRLVRYAHTAAEMKPGWFTDYFGIRTRLSNFMHDSAGLDAAQGAFPFPNDGLHSELIEYLGTAKAIESSGQDLTVVEMGAGYAPWLVFSALVAKKRGFNSLKLVAVEAERQRHPLIDDHFHTNGLPSPSDGRVENVETTVVHGAISDTRGTLHFGSSNLHDWGGALQAEAGKDYRGAQVVSDEVPALLISDVVDPLDKVDVLHIDIQGWEAKAMRASIDSVCAKVRYMVIGTHSRVIEGELIDLLRSRGWTLMHEKPCQFILNDMPELWGATTVDGAQVWANTALGAAAALPMNLTEEETALVAKTKETVGVQHRISKEHVWTLQHRIADLEKLEASVPRFVRRVLNKLARMKRAATQPDRTEA